jgi:tetratricopeptide (TPR) repeat protein
MLATARKAHRSFSTATRTASLTGPALWLGQFTDACLAALLIFAPLFMGGRGPIGQFVFVLLPVLAAVAWFARRALLGGANWRWSGAEWLLISGAALVILQLTPIPQSLLFQLSPAAKDLLPLWIVGESGSAWQLGEWSTLSLTPDFTREALAIYVAYAVLFLVLVQRLETLEDIRQLLRVVAVAAIVMAVIGLAQFFSGSTKFLWVYEHPARTACKVVRGAFQNENHLAHFLSLGLGPLIVWSIHSRQKTKRHGSASRTSSWQKSPLDQVMGSAAQPILLVSLVLVVLAGLLTFSRGGVLTMAIALIACVGVMRWKSLIDRRATLILGAAVVVNLAAILIFGYDSLSTELGTIFHSSSLNEKLASRGDLWRAMSEGISHFFRAGTGIGSHREVYPIFMEQGHGVEFTHGESGYLPLLLEAGVCGLALMLLGIVTSFYWVTRALFFRGMTQTASPKQQEKSSATPLVICACAIAPSLVASVVHSVADFVWYIPGCMVMTIAQVACACRLYQLARDSSNVSSRAATMGQQGARFSMSAKTCVALAVLFLVPGWSIVRIALFPALASLDWEAYLKYSVVRSDNGLATPSQERDRLAGMERHLTAVLQNDPRNARAHVRLAAVYLEQFEVAQRASENAMDLLQIRDAALASKFPSKAAQDAWLNIAFAETRPLLDKAQTHSRIAVRLSPLQGLGYIQLSELSFLESPSPILKKSYVDQAARVRPHAGPVLYSRGKEAALAGDATTAFKLWKEAFHQDPKIRQVLIDSLTNQMPAGFFIMCFEPDTQSLEPLFYRYIANGRMDDAKFVAQKFAPSLCTDAPKKVPSEAARCWHKAQEIYFWLEEYEKALACVQHAVELSPSEFEYRLALARLLARHQRFAEAEAHFEWCVRRRPESEDLRREIAEFKIQSLQNPAAPKMAEQSTPPDRS